MFNVELNGILVLRRDEQGTEWNYGSSKEKEITSSKKD